MKTIAVGTIGFFVGGILCSSLVLVTLQPHFTDIPKVHVTQVSALKEYEDCKKAGGKFWINRYESMGLDMSPSAVMRCTKTESKESWIDLK